MHPRALNASSTFNNSSFLSVFCSVPLWWWNFPRQLNMSLTPMDEGPWLSKRHTAKTTSDTHTHTHSQVRLRNVLESRDIPFVSVWNEKFCRWGVELRRWHEVGQNNRTAANIPPPKKRLPWKSTSQWESAERRTHRVCVWVCEEITLTSHGHTERSLFMSVFSHCS